VESIAEAEGFVKDAHEVLALPGVVLQMPAPDFDHVVSAGFVGVGGVDGKQFEQGQELVLGITLQEVVDLSAAAEKAELSLVEGVGVCMAGMRL